MIMPFHKTTILVCFLVLSSSIFLASVKAASFSPFYCSQDSVPLAKKSPPFMRHSQTPKISFKEKLLQKVLTKKLQKLQGRASKKNTNGKKYESGKTNIHWSAYASLMSAAYPCGLMLSAVLVNAVVLAPIFIITLTISAILAIILVFYSLRYYSQHRQHRGLAMPVVGALLLSPLFSFLLLFLLVVAFGG